jgi:hypothetical protein
MLILTMIMVMMCSYAIHLSLRSCLSLEANVGPIFLVFKMKIYQQVNYKDVHLRGYNVILMLKAR